MCENSLQRANLCCKLYTDVFVRTLKSIFCLSSYCQAVQFEARGKLPKLSQISHLNFMFNTGDQKPMLLQAV